MNCPHCKSPLAEEPTCHSCTSCGGVWYSRAQAEVEFDIRHSAIEQVQGAPEPSGLQDVELSVSSSKRECPYCNGAMLHLSAGGDLTLDCCERCNGLFFDEGESLLLKGKLASGFAGPRYSYMMRQILLMDLSRGPYR